MKIIRISHEDGEEERKILVSGKSSSVNNLDPSNQYKLLYELGRGSYGVVLLFLTRFIWLDMKHQKKFLPLKYLKNLD